MTLVAETLTSSTTRGAEARPSARAHAAPFWLSGGLGAGGAFVMAGAMLPWLTIYAGLDGYPGTSGLYGWFVFVGGALGIAAAVIELRMRPAWTWWTSVLLGTALLIFDLWLFAGLIEIIKRPDAVMLVPRPGAGLFVALLGSVLMIWAGVVDRIRQKCPVPPGANV